MSFTGHARKLNTRGTKVALFPLKQLYRAASPISVSIAAEMAHFPQVRECYAGVASVE